MILATLTSQQVGALPLALTITDSMTAGEAAVAGGTALLALFTAWLGLQTRSSARAAQAAVEAAEEPFVIASPSDNWEAMTLRPGEMLPAGSPPPLQIHRALDTDGTSFVRMRLWNIGSGPAIVEQVDLRRSGDRPFVDGLPHSVPVGASQGADVEVPSSAWPASSRAATLTLFYTHASGRAYETRSEVVVDDPLVFCKTYARTRAD